MISTSIKSALQQPKYSPNKTEVFNKTICTEIISINSEMLNFHYHSDYEIMFSFGAVGKSILGDETKEFAENDLIIAGPNLPHYWKIHPAQYQKSANHEIICIQFQESFLNANFCDLPEMKAVRRLLKDASRGVIINFKYPEKIKEKVTSICKKTGWSQLVELIDLLCSLGEAHYKLAVSEEFSKASYNISLGKKITYLVNFLTENYHQNLTLVEIAEIACMNSSAFCRYFKKISGKTFTEYLNHIRVNSACDKLLCTSLSISEIGYQCGYQSISYFNRQFKRIKNINPSDYRSNYSLDEEIQLSAS